MKNENRSRQSVAPVVVGAIADVKSVDPTELDLVLQNYVDVDALESLAAKEDSSWTLTFELPEHDVTVTNDGGVLVDGTVEKVWA